MVEERKVSFTGKTEFPEYQVVMGWGIFSDGEQYFVTSPDLTLLLQLSKNHCKSFDCAKRVADALNRIYF